ncbi:MAG: hydrogenase iron-sulfur subunit [Methanomassiliicoccales archaeon]|nr:hydrogenase iron-sulfur subunit [Methanomassiliicoccales archaeon]
MAEGASRAGVFVCTCGGSIGLTVGVRDISRKAKDLPEVAYVETMEYACHVESRKRMTEAIKEQKLDRLVVAACSPHLYLREFQEAAGEGGIPTCMVDLVNIREQCAWVHSRSPKEATGKAQRLVAIGVAKVSNASPTEIGHSAMVKPGACSGCGVCEATCRVSAIKMVPDPQRPGKRVAVVQPKICEGCGACVASCPSAAMDQACFSNAEVAAQIDAATPPVSREEEGFPNVVVFACHWCSYAAADLAGIKRLQMPTGFESIRTMCSARVDPEWVMRALSRGADGVLILAGKPGRCHYEVGSIRTNRRMVLLKSVIKQLGFDEGRFATVFVDSDEAEAYQRAIEEFVARIKEIGPNPLRIPEPSRQTVDYQFQGVPKSASGYVGGEIQTREEK